jgi:type VI protein secretion system component VasA
MNTASEKPLISKRPQEEIVQEKEEPAEGRASRRRSQRKEEPQTRDTLNSTHLSSDENMSKTMRRLFPQTNDFTEISTSTMITNKKLISSFLN